MTINENNLKETLEEMYGWYYKRARQRRRNEYQAGRMDGAVEALGAIYLGLYGGREMMRLWGKNLNDTETGD